MTKLEVPKHSIDPFEWKVYANWCADHFLHEEELFSRNVAKGLEKTEGRLYLLYKENGSDYVTLSGACWHTSDKNWKGVASSGYTYVWSMFNTDIVTNKTEEMQKINPFDRPSLIKNRPEVIDSFFNEMAKIGESL